MADEKLYLATEEEEAAVVHQVVNFNLACYVIYLECGTHNLFWLSGLVPRSRVTGTMNPISIVVGMKSAYLV